MRRLHDTGRTGWWTLLGIPFVVDLFWNDYLVTSDPMRAFVQTNLPLPIRIPLLIVTLALGFLLSAKDDEEPNRYGPNPRYGAPAAEPA